MSVSIWAVLGIACLLIGLPLSLVFTFGLFLLGAGTALLLVAAGQWVWERWRSAPDIDSELDDP